MRVEPYQQKPSPRRRFFFDYVALGARLRGPSDAESLTTPRNRTKRRARLRTLRMVFDFLGDKTKVVIAMAHIGALPGSPLYDADGGVSEAHRRRAQGHRGPAGRRRRRHHVRQRERPALCPQGAAGRRRGDGRRRSGGQAPSQGPVRRQLSVGPSRQHRHRRGDRRELRARDLHRPVRVRHGAMAGRLRRALCACAAISAART